MNIPKITLCMILFFVAEAPVSAHSDVVVSPIIGYMIPNEEMVFHVGEDWKYTSGGSSAVGLDFSFARLPLGLRIMLSYLNTGNVVENSNRYHDYSGNHWGVGFQRKFPLGGGGIEFSAGYLFRSEKYKFESGHSDDSEFKWDNSGFIGGVRFSAPYSATIDMTVLAKLELTAALNEIQATETGEDAILSRSGSVFIFAVGLNWNIGRHR